MKKVLGIALALVVVGGVLGRISRNRGRNDKGPAFPLTVSSQSQS